MRATREASAEVHWVCFIEQLGPRFLGCKPCGDLLPFINFLDAPWRRGRNSDSAYRGRRCEQKQQQQQRTVDETHTLQGPGVQNTRSALPDYGGWQMLMPPLDWKVACRSPANRIGQGNMHSCLVHCGAQLSSHAPQESKLHAICLPTSILAAFGIEPCMANAASG